MAVLTTSDLTDKQQSAAKAMRKRSKKSSAFKSYYIWVGATLVVCVLAVVLVAADTFSSSRKKQPSGQRGTPSNIYGVLVNDKTNIADITDQASENWTAGSSRFFDGWTIGDVMSFGGVKMSKMVGVTGISKACEADGSVEAGAVRPAYDARVDYPSCFDREVYDSKNCSSSYAISAASSLGVRFCIQEPGEANLVQLSPQQVLSCDKQSKSCRGGGVDLVWSYIETRGLYPERCLPYKGTGVKGGAPCKTDCDESQKRKAISHCVLSGRKKIKLEIEKNGPVVMPMTLYDDFLVYQSGVYSPVETARPIFSWRGGSEATLHAVMVLGWGRSEGVKYWIVENSFGREWGEQGYARIAEDTVLNEYYTLVGHPQTDAALEKKRIDDEAAAARLAAAKKARAEREAARLREQAEREAASDDEDDDDDLDDLDDEDLDDEDPESDPDLADEEADQDPKEEGTGEVNEEADQEPKEDGTSEVNEDSKPDDSETVNAGPDQ